MDDNLATGLAGIWLIFALFLVVLAILWVLVPFAIFGIKGLLHDMIATQRHTNAILIDIAKGLRDGTWPQDAKPASAPRPVPAGPAVVTPAASPAPPPAAPPPVVEDTRTLAEIMAVEAKTP